MAIRLTLLHYYTHNATLCRRTYSGWLICTQSSCCWWYIDGLCHCKFHIRRGESTGSNELFCPAYAEGCGKTELDRFVRWRLFPSARPWGRFLKSRLYRASHWKEMSNDVSSTCNIVSLSNRKCKMNKGNCNIFINFYLSVNYICLFLGDMQIISNSLQLKIVHRRKY